MKPLILCCFFMAALAHASDELTEEEFVEQLNKGKKSIDYSDSLVGHKNIHELIKKRADENAQREKRENEEADLKAKEKEKEQADLNSRSTPESETSKTESVTENKDKKSNSQGAASKNQSSTKHKKQRSQNSNTNRRSQDVDPLLTATNISGKQNAMVVDRPDQKAIVYGITIGSQFKVKLQNGANNTHGGLVMFEVTSNVAGYIQDLPAGTLLFGKASTVVGDSRLYCQIVKGITPDKEEFAMTGTIIGYDKNPGLVATVSNDGRSLERASSSAVFAMIEGAANAIPGQSIPLEAGRKGTEALVNEKQFESTSSNGRPAYIVSAQVQKAFVTVTETF